MIRIKKVRDLLQRCHSAGVRHNAPIMHSRHRRFSWISFLFLFLLTLCASPATLGADAAPDRQYAPDRTVDILHVRLDVTPDFERRSIAGQATLTFQALAPASRELRLNAVSLDVESLTSSLAIEAYEVTDELIVITFAHPMPLDQDLRVDIRYRAEPKQGLYFRTPALGYREGETHLFTQGEAITSRHWFPGFDHPNDRFSSEVVCRVPSGMTVLSNGVLLSTTEDAAGDTMTFHWKQESTHVNYLVTIVAGYFEYIEEWHNQVPLRFYTLPSEIAQAPNSFAGTRDMMAFFEEETGVAYPWKKYDQVCVNDFVAGGMEDTSLTVLTDRTLFTDATENLRSSEGLVAHELAHQWFGDLVTCKDWSQIWLNEGFATYYESLYRGHRHGKDELRLEMFERRESITGRTDDTRAIVRRDYSSPDAMFDYLSYPKASWVLHMLRTQLGPERYRHCIHTYLERHRHGLVVTEDLRRLLEEQTGQPWDRFFDQWLYHGGFPDLEISYRWDQLTRLAKISVQQSQKVSADVLLFEAPLTVRFITDGRVVDHELNITRRQEDFYLPADQAPDIVRIDPEVTLLAKLRFEPSNGQLQAQLENQDDMIGRLLAVQKLEKKADRKAIDTLRTLLEEDPFYAVRSAAAQALQEIHSDDALDALLAIGRPSDARVRHQVVRSLSRFYRERVYDALLDVLHEEKNPDIRGTAIRALGAYANDETADILLEALDSDSYRQGIAIAAMASMRSQDDPKYVAPILDRVRRSDPPVDPSELRQAMNTLSYLARNEEDRAAVREFLLAQLDRAAARTRRSAIQALGTLGDPKAIAALETFTGADPEDSERRAAEEALKKLRSNTTATEGLSTLRDEVLDLQKQNRDLKKEFDDLKELVEAIKGTSADADEDPHDREPDDRAE